LEETARKKIVGAPRGSKTVDDETVDDETVDDEAVDDEAVAGGAPPAS
jgi:hypothetical protein